MDFSIGSLSNLISDSGLQSTNKLSNIFANSWKKVKFQVKSTPKRKREVKISESNAEVKDLDITTSVPKKKLKKSLTNDQLDKSSVEDPENSNTEKKVEFLPGRDPELEIRTVFVGNVPNAVKKKKIKKLFKIYGDIECIRFRCASQPDSKTSKKVAIIKRKFHEDRTNIACFVRFKSLESATKSLELNGHILDGHHLRVDLASNPKAWVPKNAVFIGNLPFAIQEDEMWSFFETCGKIEFVRVVRDHKTGIGLGYGYVHFVNSESVIKAIKLNGSKLNERVIVIERYAKKPKAKVAVVVKDAHMNQKTFNIARQKFPLRERDGKKIRFQKVKSTKKKSVDYSGAETDKKKKRKKHTKLSKEDKKKKRLMQILSN